MSFAGLASLRDRRCGPPYMGFIKARWNNLDSVLPKRNKQVFELTSSIVPRRRSVPPQSGNCRQPLLGTMIVIFDPGSFSDLLVSTWFFTGRRAQRSSKVAHVPSRSDLPLTGTSTAADFSIRDISRRPAMVPAWSSGTRCRHTTCVA